MSLPRKLGGSPVTLFALINLIMGLNQGEKLIRESRGNYKPNPLDPLESYGGKWYLTDKRLYFRGNFTNLKNIEESISLKSIESIEAKHNDFISSKINLYLKNASIAQILVPKRNKWIQDILTSIRLMNEKEGRPWDEKSFFDVKNMSRPKGWLLQIAIKIIIFGAAVAGILFLLQLLLSL